MAIVRVQYWVIRWFDSSGRASLNCSLTSWNCVFKSVSQQQPLLSHSQRVIPPTTCRGQIRGRISCHPLYPLPWQLVLCVSGSQCITIQWSFLHLFSQQITNLWRYLIWAEDPLKFWILPSRQNLNVALPFMWGQGSSWNLGGMITRVDQNWQVIRTEGTRESDEQTGWSL